MYRYIVFIVLATFFFSCNDDDCDERERWHHRAYDNAVTANYPINEFIVRVNDWNDNKEVVVNLDGKTIDTLEIGTSRLEVVSGMTLDSLEDGLLSSYFKINGYYTGEYSVRWCTPLEDVAHCSGPNLYQCYREKIVITSFDTIPYDSVYN